MHTGQVTIEALKDAMRRMKAIPKPRPAIVQCLECDRAALKAAIPAATQPVFGIPLFGIPVHFYADAGEMAEDAFDKINEGFSVYQIKN